MHVYMTVSPFPLPDNIIPDESLWPLHLWHHGFLGLQMIGALNPSFPVLIWTIFPLIPEEESMAVFSETLQTWTWLASPHTELGLDGVWNTWMETTSLCRLGRLVPLLVVALLCPRLRLFQPSILHWTQCSSLWKLFEAVYLPHFLKSYEYYLM